MTKVIAVDLGASNGRLILLNLHEGRLELEELHRFANGPMEKNGNLFWDISFILNEIKTGLKRYVQKYGSVVDGIGIDTWGVDFGFVSDGDTLLENPYSYRDTHTVDMMDSVHRKVSSEQLFMKTGVETASINTIYQLYTIFNKRPELKDRTAKILTLPSLISFLLTGEKYNEYTHASTTQLMNWSDQNWDERIMMKVFSQKIPLANIKQTNSITGYTKDDINDATGLSGAPVINVPGHDTACALAAMPLANKDTVFMSCGTWVLMGVEVEQPVITKEAYEWGFTNEGTIDQTYRLQKNNMGLWLLQQCKKEWAEMGDEVTYEEEETLLLQASPFHSLINPDHEMFFNPDSMTDAIQEFCRQTSQMVPETKGEFIRCVLESLSLKYRWLMERIELLTGKEVSSIHMAGGGIQNKWLCQFTANATQKKVQTGPIEASAIGNSLSQLIAIGELTNLQEARELTSKSFKTNEYTPEDHFKWNQVYSKFINYL